MNSSCDNLKHLVEQANQLDEQFRQWLNKEKVNLCQYDSIEEFMQSLE